MSRTVYFTMLLLCACVLTGALSGCGQSAEAAAAGVYELDKERIKEEMQAQIDAMEDETEQAEAQMGLAFIEMMSMTLTLNEDGSASGVMSMMGESDHATGSWTIDGSQIAITLAGEGEEPETMSGTLAGDTLELEPDDDGMMPFNLVFRKRVDE